MNIMLCMGSKVWSLCHMSTKTIAAGIIYSHVQARVSDNPSALECAAHVQ